MQKRKTAARFIFAVAGALLVESIFPLAGSPWRYVFIMGVATAIYCLEVWWPWLYRHAFGQQALQRLRIIPPAPVRAAPNPSYERDSCPIHWNNRDIDVGHLAIAIRNRTADPILDLEVFAEGFLVWSPEQKKFLNVLPPHAPLLLRRSATINPSNHFSENLMLVHMQFQTKILHFSGIDRKKQYREEGVYQVRLRFRWDKTEFVDETFVSWRKGGNPSFAPDPRL